MSVQLLLRGPNDPNNSEDFCLQFTALAYGHTCFGWKGSQSLYFSAAEASFASCSRAEYSLGSGDVASLGPPRAGNFKLVRQGWGGRETHFSLYILLSLSNLYQIHVFLFLKRVVRSRSLIAKK